MLRQPFGFSLAYLAPGTFALTILLGFLTALGPLSTDLMLPSLPAIARYFSASNGDAQLVLSAQLTGFALGLPFYGPVSDRRGRKSVLFFGLALYGIASVLATLAPSLEWLIAARLLQGLGASGPIVVTRAIVRDLYEGRRAAQELGRMGTIMGVVPAIAPLFGAGLEIAFGWRANFAACFVLAAALGVWAGMRMPETLRQKLTEPFSLGAMFREFGALLRDRRFFPFGILAAATFAGLFSFISGSSFVYQLQFGVGAFAFALAFGTMTIGYMAGAFTAQRLAIRIEPRRLLLLGALLQAGGGLLMLALTLSAPSPWGITIPMAIYAAGVGFSLPQSQAGAMMPFPERAGAVSSLLGIIQMGGAAIAGASVGALIDHGPVVLAGAIATFGMISLAVQPLVRRAISARTAG